MARGSKPRWFRCNDKLEPAEELKRLPAGALVSADGNWAELRDGDELQEVFVRITGRVELPKAKSRAA